MSRKITILRQLIVIADRSINTSGAMEQPHTPKRKCSATGKVVFASHEEAKLAIFGLKWNYRMKRDPIDGKRIKHRQGRPQQRRAYYCAYCGGFHLTKMETPFPENRDEPREPPLSPFVGVVKRFDVEEGSGVVVLPGARSIYIRRNVFPEPFLAPQTGDVVVGHHRDDAARGKDVIVYCRQIGELEDWELLAQLLGRNGGVCFADRGGRFASVYGHSERARTFPLLELGAMQLCLVHNDEALHRLFFSYYCTELDPKRFVYFATVIERAMLFSRGEDPAKRFLDGLFNDFGEHVNTDVLFRVWQKRAFRFLGYPQELEELELNREVFEQQRVNIRTVDLARIHRFSYGPEFCTAHVTAMLDRLEQMTGKQLKMMLVLLQYLPHSQRGEWTAYTKLLIIHRAMNPPD